MFHWLLTYHYNSLQNIDSRTVRFSSVTSSSEAFMFSNVQLYAEKDMQMKGQKNRETLRSVMRRKKNKWRERLIGRETRLFLETERDDEREKRERTVCIHKELKSTNKYQRWKNRHERAMMRNNCTGEGKPRRRRQTDSYLTSSSNVWSDGFPLLRFGDIWDLALPISAKY